MAQRPSSNQKKDFLKRNGYELGKDMCFLCGKALSPNRGKRLRKFCSKSHLSQYCKMIVRKGSLNKPKKPTLPKDFYNDKRWLTLRYEALRSLPRECCLCKATNVEIHVDHIKPKSKYPELAFELNNLQILCRECNLGKSNKYEDDWRDPK